MEDFNFKYKDISAQAKYYADESMYYGKIEGIEDLVTFGGKTMKEINEDFKNAVDDYLSERNQSS